MNNLEIFLQCWWPPTFGELKEKYPTILKIYGWSDGLEVGHIIIFVNDPYLNDLIQEKLSVGLWVEFITWSFDGL